MPKGATVDDVIASITAYAAGNENLDVAAESQPIRGMKSTVLRGRSSSADTNTQVQLVPTSSTTAFSIAPGEELVVYVIEGPSQLIVARIVSAEGDMAWAVDRIASVLESIEFP